jgi:hypothetical protein
MESALKVRSKPALNSYWIKMIAIVAMVIDHVACAFVPFSTPLGQVMRTVGQMPAPVMCYFIAEGYYHTHNIKKYILRLAVFAVISYIPFVFFCTKKLPCAENFFILDMIYTLLLGLLALCAWDKIKSQPLKILAIVGLCILDITGDWPIFGILYILCFGINRENTKKQILWFSIITICAYASYPVMTLLMNDGNSIEILCSTLLAGLPQFGAFLALPLVYLYNGERGGGKASKWFFYIFYPAHLLVLGLLKFYLT